MRWLLPKPGDERDDCSSITRVDEIEEEFLQSIIIIHFRFTVYNLQMQIKY